MVHGLVSVRYLEVKVGDVFGVQVGDTVQDLLEELGGLLLRQRLLLGQEVKELPSGHQLQNEDHVRLVLEDVVQSDDVAVLDLPQDVDLALNLLSAHPSPAGRQPPLLDELGGVLGARSLLLALTDDGKLSTGRGQDNRDVNKRLAILSDRTFFAKDVCVILYSKPEFCTTAPTVSIVSPHIAKVKEYIPQLCNGHAKQETMKCELHGTKYLI